jgi:CHRD domain
VLLAIASLAFALPASLPGSTIYTAPLSGAAVVPANLSTATGFVTLTLTGNSLGIVETFSGLGTPASSAHLDCCGAANSNFPVAIALTGFPTSTSGSYSNSFDLTLTATYSSGFLTGAGGTAAAAEAELISALNSGQVASLITDSLFPSGEIRAQLTAVPEPTSFAPMFLGLAAIVSRIRKQAR